MATTTTVAAALALFGGDLIVSPFVVVAGGVYYEQLPEKSHSEDIFVTAAVSRFGLRGAIGDHITFESEFEANLGVSSSADAHGPGGTSVWEGMAALSVRNQTLTLSGFGAELSAGILTDPASMDYVSKHVFDLLLTDHHSRDPLIRTGFNRGKGVRASYELVEGLSAGVSFFAGNPTSMTGTSVIGGQFSVFPRFYLVPAANVGRSSSNLPGDSFHAMIATPGIIYESEYISVRAAGQFFTANTNTESKDDQKISGFNVRGTARGKIEIGGLAISPFASVSVVQNDIADPTDLSRLIDDKWNAMTFGGGVDIDWKDLVGVGAWYVRSTGRQGEQPQIVEQWLNVGASLFLNGNSAIGARVAFFDSEVAEQGWANRSYYLTIRLWV